MHNDQLSYLFQRRWSAKSFQQGQLTARSIELLAAATACIVSCLICIDNIAFAGEASSSKLESPQIYLVLDNKLNELLEGKIPGGYQVVPRTSFDKQKLVDHAAAGGHVVWIGPPKDVPRDFWVGDFQPAKAPLDVRSVQSSPVELPALPTTKARVSSAYIRPPQEFPKHNLDEEIRAEFLPIFEAYDKFGQLVGYPAVLISHTGASLVGGRFDASECYFFFFDDPATAWNADQWLGILQAIRTSFDSSLQIRSFTTNFASYQPGERAQFTVKVRNSRPQAVAMELHFSVSGPGQSQLPAPAPLRRVIAANDEIDVSCEYLVPKNSGLIRAQVEVRQDAKFAETLAVLGAPQTIARRETGFVVIERPLQTQNPMEISGANLRFDHAEGFVAGTHYYPSSSWWEWAWRDYQPTIIDRDFQGMRQAANRIVRVWVDPILDERALRAMDAMIVLAAKHEIVLDFCVFTQWVDQLTFERPTGEQVTFQFRHKDDFNVYSISLRNLDLQREYLKTLGSRWKKAGNIIFNLANETFINAPDESQMDAEVLAWEEAASEPGELRNTLLFRRWAQEMTEALRQSGATQPIFGGYIFSMNGGGDNYLANSDGPIVPWHAYTAPTVVASTLQYFDPLCTGRPLVLEEFGTTGWNNEAHYDAAAHNALAAGAAAAMSYEWGVSRLAQESCFFPLPIRDALVENPDPRWFQPATEYAKVNCNEKGVGIAPFASGFGYGSIYHGTPFPAEAARALARVGTMARTLARISTPEKVYVVIPQARTAEMAPYLELFEKMWRAGVEFGVWQEAQLESIPQGVRTLIYFGKLSPASEVLVQSLRAKGVEIVTQPNDEWLSSADLSRIQMSPSGVAKALVRRTTRGTLYSLFAENPLDRFSVTNDRHRVQMGLNLIGLVLTGPDGVAMVEASGAVEIDGEPCCVIDQGRAILLAEESASLLDAKKISLMTTQPTQISFPRVVRSLDVMAESQSAPLATIEFDPGTKVVTVDDELVRYKLILTFEPDSKNVSTE